MKSSGFTPISFHREVRSARMLKKDDAGNLVEATAPVEFRFDPLTGHSCRLVPFTLERIIRPDLDTLEKRSRELTCPFCPPLLERITPKFVTEIAPEGNIRRGRAYGFPNATPYDVYGAVIVLSEDHFVRLHEFTPEMVSDTLIAAQSYVKSISRADPEARYHFLAWNYMPPSGGSLVHPHVQANAGYYPTTFQKQVIEGSERYFEANGTNYWSDLLAQEKASGERYIGSIGGTEWLTAFAPRGRLSDVICLFPGRASAADLSEDDLKDLSTGLLKVFGFLDETNLLSFNLATYSGFDSGRFWAHARLTPRASLLYSPIETSDQFYYQVLQDENICILPPEVAAERLRPRFDV